MTSDTENMTIKSNSHNVHRDDVASQMGMWLFLFTELLLFGGLFILYASYRYMYPEEFKISAFKLDTAIGALNTIILLTSSLTVALSVAAIQKGNKKFSVYLLGFTILMGSAFLVNKYFEWGHKIQIGIYPKGPELTNFSNGEIIFFGLYFVMTGLHALHVLAGLIFIGVILLFVIKEKITADNFQRLENAGLYWHLVDIIWIFLFPLFYLIH